jgi:TadE-like protein
MRGLPEVKGIYMEQSLYMLTSHLPRRRRRARPDQQTRSHGQALVEFALVVPVLLMLLFGTIQLGVTFGGYNGLINGVREAARYGSVCTGGTCGSDTAQRAIDRIHSGVFAYVPGSEHAVVTYTSYQDAALLWNTQVSVTACVKGIVFIPFLGNILGWTDPSGVYLKSSETFRVEGQPSASPQALPAGGSQGTCK